MFGNPPRWTCTFSQPLEVWKSMPGYPFERHATPAVFVTCHSVLMVPAAPCVEATVTVAVRSEHTAMAGVEGALGDGPTGEGVRCGAGETLGCTLLPGTGCRPAPTPKARLSAYMPPLTPARSATTSVTVWTRCITRRCRFRLPTSCTIREGSGRSSRRPRVSLMRCSRSGIVRHPFRRIVDVQGRGQDLPRPVQRGLDRSIGYPESPPGLRHGHPQVVVHDGHL